MTGRIQRILTKAKLSSCEFSYALLGSAFLDRKRRAIEHVAEPIWHDDAKIIHRFATVVAGMDDIAVLVGRDTLIERVTNLLFAKQPRVCDEREPFLIAPGGRDRR